MINIWAAICALGFHVMEWHHSQGTVYRKCVHCEHTELDY